MNSEPINMDRMLGALLRLPSQAIIRHIEDEVARVGYDDISPAQFVPFQYLPPEGARITEMADRAGITKQSMSALVRTLIENGYLERRPDPSDRRASIIVRTKRGWEIERIARAAISALVDEWRSALAPGQLDAGIEMLVALADHLEAQHDEAIAQPCESDR